MQASTLFVEIFAHTNFRAFSRKNSKCAKICTKISLKGWVRENKSAPKQCFDHFFVFCLYYSLLCFSAILRFIYHKFNFTLLYILLNISILSALKSKMDPIFEIYVKFAIEQWYGFTLGFLKRENYGNFKTNEN